MPGRAARSRYFVGTPNFVQERATCIILPFGSGGKVLSPRVYFLAVSRNVCAPRKVSLDLGIMHVAKVCVCGNFK